MENGSHKIKYLWTPINMKKKIFTITFEVKFGPKDLTEMNFVEQYGRTALLLWRRKK